MLAQRSYSFFQNIMSSFSNPSELIVDYLEIGSLMNLIQVSKTLRDNIKNSNYIVNKICYSKYFRNNDLIEQIFQVDVTNNYNQDKRIKQFLMVSQINLKVFENSFSFIRSQMIKNLKCLVNLDIANQITTSYFDIMFSTNIPLPKLRRQNVGMYCSSNFQLMLADYSLATETLEYQSNNFEIISECINQKKEEIYTQIQYLQQAYKLSLQGQLIQQYIQTKSPFLNILNLLISGIDTYLKGSKNIIEFMYKKNEKYNSFIQFMIRYQNYRNMIIQMEECFGFLFQKFTNIFSMNNKKFQKNPFCSLWRIMIKKWINTFQEFHQNNNHCYNFTMLIHRQNFLNKYIVDNQEQINKDSYFKYISNSKTSEIYLSNHELNLQDHTELMKSQQSLQRLIQSYNDYLIDTSVNQVTINWCGNSQQLLGNIFQQSQKSFLLTYIKYLNSINKIFGNTQQKYKILEKELRQISQNTKAVTLKKILKLVSRIEHLKTPIYLHKTKNQIYTQISQRNSYINYVNQSRNIYQNIPQENLDLLAFENKVTFSDFQQINKQDNATTNDGSSQEENEIIRQQDDPKQRIMKIRKEIQNNEERYYNYEETREIKSYQLSKKRKCR